MGLRNIQVVKQTFSLGHVVNPSDPLNPATGLPGLAPVKDDTSVLSDQVVHQFDPSVNAERGPFFQRCVEASWREH
jgi:hypothetical protein